MTRYEHRQPATALVVLLVGAAVGTAAIAVVLGPRAPWAAAVLAGTVVVLLLCAWAFNGLAVRVTDEEVVVAFGPGWIRRRIPRGDVQGARAVANRWWYGWGIRWTPGGWLWNVGGLRAVELSLSRDRRFRIGTDEPEALLAALAPPPR